MRLIHCWVELLFGNLKNYSKPLIKWMKNGIEKNWWSLLIQIILVIRELYIPVISIGYLSRLQKIRKLQKLDGSKIVNKTLFATKLNDSKIKKISRSYYFKISSYYINKKFISQFEINIFKKRQYWQSLTLMKN